MHLKLRMQNLAISHSQLVSRANNTSDLKTSAVDCWEQWWLMSLTAAATDDLQSRSFIHWVGVAASSWRLSCGRKTSLWQCSMAVVVCVRITHYFYTGASLKETLDGRIFRCNFAFASLCGCFAPLGRFESLCGHLTLQQEILSITSDTGLGPGVQWFVHAHRNAYLSY